jgi:hypothetical protein
MPLFGVTLAIEKRQNTLIKYYNNMHVPIKMDGPSLKALTYIYPLAAMER